MSMLTDFQIAATLKPYLFTIAGALCGFIPRYFARRLRVPEVGSICVFVCAMAGYVGTLRFIGEIPLLMIPVVVILITSLWWFGARIPSPEEVGAHGRQMAKKHPVLAVFFDLRFFNILFAGVLVLSAALVPARWMVNFGIILGIGLSFYLFIYPRFSSRRKISCTWGERMAGCVLENRTKEWYSVFTQSRGFLFFTLLVLLLYPENVFRSIIQKGIQGETISIELVLLQIGYAVLFLVSIYKLAQGQFGWSLVSYVLLSLPIIFHAKEIDIGTRIVSIGERVGVVNLSTMSLLTIVLAYYSHAKVLEVELWPRHFEKFMIVTGSGILVVGLITFAGIPSITSPEVQWITYASHGENFSVDFPGDPVKWGVTEEKSLFDNILGNGKAYVTRFEYMDRRFMMTRLIYTEKIEKLGNAEAIFEWIKESPEWPVVSEWSVVDEQPIQLGELQGLEYLAVSSGDNKKNWYRNRIFYDENRIYRVSTLSWKKEMSTNEQKFFDSLRITTSGMIEEKQVVTESLIRDVVVAGSGEFLVIKMGSHSSELAIYSTEEQQFVAKLPLSSSYFLYTAGGNRVLVYYPEKKAFQTWDLDTFQEVNTKPEPLGTRVYSMSMGHSNHDVALIRYRDLLSYKKTDQDQEVDMYLLNLSTLQDILYNTKQDNSFHVKTRCDSIYQRTDGKLLYISDFSFPDLGRLHLDVNVGGLITRSENSLTTRYKSLPFWYIAVGDDQRLYTSTVATDYTSTGVIYNHQLKQIASFPKKRLIPGIGGAQFLAIDKSGLIQVYASDTRTHLGNVGFFPGIDSYADPMKNELHLNMPMTFDRRVTFDSSHKRLILIPPENNRIIQRHFTLKNAPDTNTK